MEITTSFYALLVLVLAVHHTVKKITPKKSTKLIVGLTGVAFSLALAFIPHLSNVFSAIALMIAVGANIVLQSLFFMENVAIKAMLKQEPISVDQ